MEGGRERERKKDVSQTYRLVASHGSPNQVQGLNLQPKYALNWESNQRPFGCRPTL